MTRTREATDDEATVDSVDNPAIRGQRVPHGGAQNADAVRRVLATARDDPYDVSYQRSRVNASLSLGCKTPRTTEMLAEIFARDGDGLHDNESVQINNFTVGRDRTVDTMESASHLDLCPKSKERTGSA